MTDETLVCPACQAVNRVPAGRDPARARCGSCRAPLLQGTPLAVDASGFERFLERDALPLLVDFWADWCGPCRMMAPELDRVAATAEGRLRVLKLNTDAHPDAASRYGIRGLPTVVLFRKGREIARQTGAMQHSGIVAWLRDQGIRV